MDKSIDGEKCSGNPLPSSLNHESFHQIGKSVFGSSILIIFYEICINNNYYYPKL